MNGKIHSFRTEYRKGRAVEAILDELLRCMYRVRPASRAEQRAGADRILTGWESGRSLRAEYKADYRAAETGNAFIELACGEEPGWAKKLGGSDILLYALPQEGRALLLHSAEIAEALPSWEARFGARSVLNGTYESRGLLVPLAELEALSLATLDFPKVSC